MEAFERHSSSSSSTTTGLFSVIRRACSETEPQQVSGLFSTRCDLLQCSPAGFLAASAFRASNSCGSNNYLDQPEETGQGTAVVSSDPVVRLKPSPRCRVKSCGTELSKAKEYHRRHRVCEEHAKAPLVIVDALEQRFCQQCSRFQMVGEFDDNKRSCRRRLATHNERRRKSSQETVALIATVLEEHGQSLGAGNYFPQPANFDWMRCPENNNVTKIWSDSPPLHLHSYHLDKSNEETFAFFSNPTGSSYSSPLYPNNYTSNTAQLAETVPGHVLSLLSPPPIDINDQTSFSKRAFNLNQSFYYPLPLATASSSATTTPACLIDNSARLGDAASSTTHHPPFSMTMPRGIMVWPPLT